MLYEQCDVTLAINTLLVSCLVEGQPHAGLLNSCAVHAGFQARYGNNTGGIVMMGIPLIALFFCGATSVASNAR